MKRRTRATACPQRALIASIRLETSMKRFQLLPVLFAILWFQSCTPEQQNDQASLKACAAMITEILQPVPKDRADRFEAKVAEATARCRGGKRAVQGMLMPWVDWGNYYGTGDASSKAPGVVTSVGLLSPTD